MARPKKDATASATQTVQSDVQAPAVKRGRGRPRKNAAQTVAQAPAMKRGRGRPRKNATVTAPVAAPAATNQVDQGTKGSARIRHMPAPTRTRPDNLNLQGLTTKRSRVILHVHGGDASGGSQKHMVLWSNEDSPDAFHGGIAEMAQGENGKAVLSIPKKFVQLNGKSYYLDMEPINMFVQRTERNGRIRALAVFKGKKQVGEVKFRKTFAEKNVPLVGVFNFGGLKFDDQFHIVDSNENLTVTAEVIGGLRDEVVAMYKERAEAIQAKKAKVPRKYTKRGSKENEESAAPVQNQQTAPTEQQGEDFFEDDLLAAAG